MIAKLLDSKRPLILGRVKLGEWEKGKAATRFDEFKLAKMIRGSNNEMIEDTETRDHIKKKLNLKKEDKLTRIPIYFSGNTLSDVFDSWYEMRWGKRAYCIGDGTTAQRAVVSVNNSEPKAFGNFDFPKDIQTVEIKDWMKKDCCEKGCKTYDPDPDSKSKCKMACKLLFHIQGLTRRGGMFEFRSHSYYSTSNLAKGLKEFEDDLYSHLSLLPFDLVVEPKKNRNNIVMYIAHLEMTGDIDSLRHRALENAQNEIKYITEIKKYREESRKLLTVKPEDISDDEGEAETQEFYSADVKKVDVEVKDEKSEDDSLF